jgi:secondary thiamine-phosphate synthase enzyme
MTSKLLVETRSQVDFVDIDSLVEGAVATQGITDGVCHVYVPHTTAGITINENADPDVKRDIVAELNKIVPFDDGYRHAEGNSAAHIKASLVGFSVSVPVESGRLLLGTWQSIYLCEFDGPRRRSVLVTVMT